MSTGSRHDDFERDDLGLFLPRGTRARPTAGRQRELPFQVSIYITYNDLSEGKCRMDEAGVVNRLKLLSVEDCLAALAHISTRLFSTTDPSSRAHQPTASVDRR